MSQGEAKGETKDFIGSQEAKSFGGKINFYLRTDLTEIKQHMHNAINSASKSSMFLVMNALALSWLLTKEIQGEAKS